MSELLDELLELEELLVEEELDSGLKLSPESVPEKSPVGDSYSGSTAKLSLSTITSLDGEFKVGITEVLQSCSE